MRQRERGDRRDQPPRALHQDHQRQHEQQVIEADQDVLDAEHGVGMRHLEGPRAGGDDKARREWQHASDLRRAVAALHAHQHVDAAGSQVREFDRLASQPAFGLHAPALHRRARGITAAQWRDGLCAGRELRVQLQRGGFVQRRQLPQHLVGGGVELAQLQVGGAEFVRRGRHHRTAQQQPQCQEAAQLGHGVGFACGRFGSITTS